MSGLLVREARDDELDAAGTVVAVAYLAARSLGDDDHGYLSVCERAASVSPAPAWGEDGSPKLRTR